MKYVFVFNPKAGEAGAEAVLREKLSRLSAGNELYVTKGPGDATVFVRKYAQEHPGEELCFVAGGGDGTINEVFNGAVGLENVCVSCYPCGSGNDFVKVFGAERFLDPENLVRGRIMEMDLLKVGDRYSDNIVNFGFDTTVAITVNTDRDKKGHGSKSSYTKGIIKALLTSMNNRFTVIADGEVLNPDGRALLCTLGNGQYVGGSFKCSPRAELDDGWMEVCLCVPISIPKFATMLGDYTAGRHLDNEKYKSILIYRRAKKVEVIAGEPGFAYSLDGEIIYQDRFTVEVAPKALRLVVPE